MYIHFGTYFTHGHWAMGYMQCLKWEKVEHERIFLDINWSSGLLTGRLQRPGFFCMISHETHYVDVVFLNCLQCFDAVGWASGRASGL